MLSAATMSRAARTAMARATPPRRLARAAALPTRYSMAPSRVQSAHRPGFSRVRPVSNGVRHLSTTAGAAAPSVADRFEVLQTADVPDYECSLTLYRHKATGGRVMSVTSEEENKVFGVSFRTPVSDDTGVPHVLEHSVLCGSEKYPLKEPFVELLKSSVQTFLNAFTYPDRTCYPVSSQNTKDFYNLVDVYMDATFHPRLTPSVLKQEGWHLEVEEGAEAEAAATEAGDAAGAAAPSALSYKGVVFNEMKGVFSSADQVHSMVTQQAMFPDTTYAHCSGGDPAAIPDLTFEQFSDFHTSNYHPSNAYVYFFGNDDPARRLEIVDEYFRDYTAKDVDASRIGIQPLWTEPRRVESTYPSAADAGDRHMSSLSWVLTDEDWELSKHYEWYLLDRLLTGTNASPLIKALFDSGLGEDVIGHGFDNTLRQPTWSIGMKGVAAEDVPKLEALILSELTKYAEEGFDRETVEAALNSIEFRVREPQRGGHGLGLMLQALQFWIYDNDPVNSFYFEKPLRELREKALNTTILQDLVKQLVANQHRLAVDMSPDPGFTAGKEAAEAERLAAIRSGLDDAGVERVAREAEELRAKQEAPDSPEALALVPTLELEDLDRAARLYPQEVGVQDATTVVLHEQPTQKIVYATLGYDLTVLKESQLSLLPLFTRCLRELGTDSATDVIMQQRIDTDTGGVGFSTSVIPQRGNPDAVTAHLFCSGKALSHKAGSMTDIMTELLLHAQFDQKERVRSFLKEQIAGTESALVSSGHSVAASFIASQMSLSGWVDAQKGGLPCLDRARQLLANLDDDWEGTLAELNDMRDTLLRSRTMLSLTSDGASLGEVRPDFDRLLSTVASADPLSHVSAWDWKPTSTEPTALVVPTQVNFVAKGAMLGGDSFHGSGTVISNYLRTSWLWDRVRVTGGAYGAGGSLNPFTGLFVFTSYRDPNLMNTLQNFDATADFLRDPNLPQEEVRKAIISTIGDLDGPLTPGDRGSVALSRYLQGISDEEVQRRRDEIFGTTTKDFVEFGERLSELSRNGLAAAVVSAEALQDPAAAEYFTKTRQLL